MKLLYTIQNLVSRNENFSNLNVADKGTNSNLIISYIISIVIYVALILLLGKWIWNNVLVRLVSNVNKVKNPIDLLWLHLLFSILVGTL